MEPQRGLYALFMLLALGVFLLARRLLPRSDEVRALPWKHRLALAVAAFVGGVLGGKLPFVLMSGESWLGAAWLQDGKTITTALAGGYLAVELTKLYLGIRVKTGDSFALPLALALAVGRWGCLCNGCCFGVATTLPWGVDFGDGVLRHPTQIYESLFHFGMAAVLLWLTARSALPHQRLKLYLIAYGAYRFLTEYIRPEPEILWGLTFYQWVSLGLIVGLTAQWLADRRPHAGHLTAHTVISLPQTQAASDRIPACQSEAG
jgi:prolipoprotein diacylglyceryltransferase